MEELEIDIKELLCPTCGELSFEDEVFSTLLLDEELDEFRCSFNGDDCITIDTEKLSYLVLSIDTLYRMINLIEESNELISEL